MSLMVPCQGGRAEEVTGPGGWLQSHRDRAGVRRRGEGPCPWEGFRPVSALHKGSPGGVAGRLGTSGPRKPAGPPDSADQLAGVWGAWANISTQGPQVLPAPRQVPAVRLQERLG